MNHGLMPGNKVKYKSTTGEVTERGAESGKGYFVTVKFRTLMGSKVTKFWNTDIKQLKKI